MSNQMISSGSAAHAGGGVNVTGAISAIKKQLIEIRKLLVEHKKEIRGLDEINKKYDLRLEKMKRIDRLNKSFNSGKSSKNITQNFKISGKYSKQILINTRRILSETISWAKRLGKIDGKYSSILSKSKQIRQNSSGIGSVATTKVKQPKRGTSIFPGGPAGTSPNGWASGAAEQLKYWGRLRLMFTLYQKIRAGFSEFGEVEGTINRALRTSVKDLSDWNEVARARNELQESATRYLSEHIGSVAEYTEAIYQLTQAEMERSEAIKLAPTIMSLAKALDAPIAESSRLMVGLNELFKDNLKGMETDSERINHIASVMAVAVKKEVTSVEMLTKSLGYVAPLAKIAGISIEEVVGSIAVLHTNLMLASRAGTGMRQMLNAITKDPKRLNKAFDLEIDPKAPLQYLHTLEQLSKKLKGGDLSVEKISELLGGFKLRGAPSAIILAQEIDEITKRIHQLKGAKLDDLLGMRDIVEKNVPAQMKILSKNVDMVIASFLRGAFGGQSMADSLANVNSGMMPIILTGKSLGDVFSILNNKSVIITGALALLIGKIYKLGKVHGSVMKGLKNVSMGSWIGVLMAGLTGILYLYNKNKLKNEELIKQYSKNSEAHKKESSRLNNLAQSLTGVTVSKERLTTASALLSAEARNRISSIKNETAATQALISELKKEATAKQILSEKTASRGASKLLEQFGTGQKNVSFPSRTPNYEWPAFAIPDFKQAESFFDDVDWSKTDDQIKKAEEFLKAAKNADWEKPDIESGIKNVLRDTYEPLARYENALKEILANPGTFKSSDIDFAKNNIQELTAKLNVLDNVYKNTFSSGEAKVQTQLKTVKELVKKYEYWREDLADLMRKNFQGKISVIDKSDLSVLGKVQQKMLVYRAELRKNKKEYLGITSELNKQENILQTVTDSEDERYQTAKKQYDVLIKKAADYAKVNGNIAAEFRSQIAAQNKLLTGKGWGMFGAQAETNKSRKEKYNQEYQNRIEVRSKEIIKESGDKIPEAVAKDQAEKETPKKSFARSLGAEYFEKLLIKQGADFVRTNTPFGELTKSLGNLGDPAKSERYLQAMLTNPRQFFSGEADKSGNKDFALNDAKEFVTFLQDSISKMPKELQGLITPENIYEKGFAAVRDVLPEKFKAVFDQIFGAVLDPSKQSKLESEFVKLGELLGSQKIYFENLSKATGENTLALLSLSSSITGGKNNGEKNTENQRANFFDRFPKFMPKQYYLPGPDKVKSPTDGESAINNFGRVNLTLNLDGKEIEKVVTEQGKTIDVVLPITEKLKEAQVKTEKQRLAFGQRMAQYAQV